ncbi:3-phosphoshikimate 1-carboxyvinyltransferase [Acutalibacter sp. 1XD8-33]|uniref:3-phosphoshikimate 1-carboxyvinyltransferase n=1 Tax=Acutalibacter sp. 1XD8-33 TaxID=2320081 RepID=UPI000EA1CED0|nr:3-phosphoshikimate 1-carboxyvinyltransferase [Acutalibacter sp. 1XD8-33]RKJ40333.1 3-phosphoshikimate 1-carboxyvinyltransferase [Acutalibacter sp. 1XD8-33]
MYQVKYGSHFSGGKVTVPPSKSAAIRALLCAALTQGGCLLENIELSDDVLATMKAVEALGAKTAVDPSQKNAWVKAGDFAGGSEVDCGESGSLLRFIIPIAAALGGSWRFAGRGRLPQRPIGVYQDLLPTHGVNVSTQGGLPLEIEGQLKPGRFELPGDISSQFVTGLMFALPLLDGDSEIVLTSPLESCGYVDMTWDILGDFGVKLISTHKGWRVPGKQRYRGVSYSIEGDWSQAAFFLNMAALSPQGSEVRIAGLNPESLQGDMACLEVFGGFGLETCWEKGELIARNPRAGEPFGGLTGQDIDVSQITDMVPAASVCAALSKGETRFVNGRRLRLKESDRLAAMKQAINALGGQAREEGDDLIIQGVESLAGGVAQGCNDHRVLMALAGAGLRSQAPVQVTDAWSIQKTYPNFYDDFRNLGGEADVIQLG